MYFSMNGFWVKNQFVYVVFDMVKNYSDMIRIVEISLTNEVKFR